MFLGVFEYKVDIKGRVPIPPKFRGEFKAGMIASQGLEKKYIEIRTEEEFNKLANELKAEVLPGSKIRMLNRSIFGSSQNIELDGQNRIALPLQLRQYAQIQDIVVIVGVNDHIELWNPSIWESEKSQADEEATKIIDGREGRP